MKIIQVYGYEVLNDIGLPTLACIIKTDTGAVGKAVAPININYDGNCCDNLYDKDKNRYNGKGLKKAVNLINKNIANMLIGLNITNQKQIDKLLIMLDGTTKKTYYGAITLLCVSMAITKTAANELHLPLYRYIREYLLGNKTNNYLLPVPIVSMINLSHISNDGYNDFVQISVIALNVDSFAAAMEKVSKLFYALQAELNNQKIAFYIDNNGAIEFKLDSLQAGIDLLLQVAASINFKISMQDEESDFLLSINFCANLFYDKLTRKYNFPIPILAKEPFVDLSNDDLLWQIIECTKIFPILNVEEPFALQEEDYYKKIVKKTNNKIQITSDQLFSSNPYLIKLGIKNNLANSVIIKLDEIGTISEVIESVLYAKELNWTAIIAASSFSTENTFIADLAVGLGTGQIQVGGYNHSEIIAKYNRLLEIELELDQNGFYKNKEVFYNLKDEDEDNETH